MKDKKKEIIEPEKKRPKVMKNDGRYGIYLSVLLLFVISALYFMYFGNYLFSYQDNETLFVYSRDYLHQYLSKPGGLLEYGGNFLTQLYFSALYGSLLLASLFVLIAWVSGKIGKVLYGDGPFLLTLAVLPSCMLMLLQTDFNFLVYNHLGFFLASVCFLLAIKSEKRYRIIFPVVLFPACYLLAGGYAWLFAAMYILYNLLNKNVLYPVVLVITAALTLFSCKEIFFFQPLNELVYYPLPQISSVKVPVFLYATIGLFIFYPVISKLIRLVSVKPENVRSISFYLTMIIFSGTIFMLSKQYNPDISNLFKLEKLVYQRNWNEVIKIQERIQSRNMVAQYYYNLALSETNQLCDRMFFGRQDFGPRSILMQWDSKANINQIFRGAYFFYDIGLINEAHRWAFESMVIQGFRPENIKLLIKTDLINGHYKVAEKYINVLKRTIRYRKWAEKYGNMLFHPELVRNDPELGAKFLLQPKEDFMISIKDQQDNILLLLQSNPDNKKAFEYMMAWYMLERNTGKVAEEIKKMKGMGYTRLPRHLEEAAVIFNAGNGESPDPGGLSISEETKDRFHQYESAVTRLDNLVTTGESNLRKSFGNTYWYYVSGFK